MPCTSISIRTYYTPDSLCLLKPLKRYCSSFSSFPRSLARGLLLSRSFSISLEFGRILGGLRATPLSLSFVRSLTDFYYVYGVE